MSRRSRTVLLSSLLWPSENRTYFQDDDIIVTITVTVVIVTTKMAKAAELSEKI